MKATKTRMFRRIQARFITKHWFGIPMHIANEFFWDYYIKYKEGSFLLASIKEGEIKVGQRNFLVQYNSGLTRGYILAHQEEQYACSFRIPKDEFNLPSYVLIGKAE